jgi:hypothetical protein
MSRENRDAQTNDETPTSAGDAGAGQVQSQLDKEQAQGFRGTEVDQTPNENYSVSGVTSGAPTPETDAEQKRKATQTGDSK